MTVSLRRLSPQEFALHCPTLVGIYVTAMGYDPAITNNRSAAWRREISNPGFSCVVAVTEDEIVGLAYGFIGNPDTWWDRQLRRGLRSQAERAERTEHTERAEHTAHTMALLRSYFEVAEIHVLPLYQGLGIGRKLLHELLWQAPAKFALLSTPEIDNESNRAFGLYRSLGFFDVLRHHVYPGDDRPFAVLGVELPLPR